MCLQGSSLRPQASVPSSEKCPLQSLFKAEPLLPSHLLVFIIGLNAIYLLVYHRLPPLEYKPRDREELVGLLTGADTPYTIFGQINESP